MSLYCAVDEAEYYVELLDPLIVSPGTEFCIECGRLIPCGEEHYKVREWFDDIENGREVLRAERMRCCEECGDLALSFMDLGYCWSYGSLREDIIDSNA